ncbi:hypothetical protein LG296_19580 (plasmid) [Ureibacillus chungkukjangi]|uniref:hypothetical protein n=1 Tax=Ureibacillus chungkukjangi TaxID=1202712 RepID=UPI000D34D8AE|nr:hypothetical protein [Ureibacillus chungkukjangi]MCM3390215.1 hypothetical protein [Ureibacillus chungkukjangi]HCG4536036.1 hypothetical protein [Salmonella enterica subsp. enterica serovar Typhi str. AG3]
MAIRLRTKKLIYSGLAGAGIMLVISSTGGYLFYQKAQEREIELKQEYQEQVKELELTASQSVQAYALNTDVIKGELITLDMLTPVYVPDAAASDDLFAVVNLSGENAKNYYAKTDWKADTVLTDSMLYKETLITEDVREAEYSFIELPTNIANEDYIDIRIQFPSGDDFILLSKKQVKNVAGLTLWLDVDEGEILTMSSAMVDAYLEKAKIYAMPYVDEHMQGASEMTYPVKANVKELIESSPNIVNRAKLNLTDQNRARVEANLNSMDAGDAETVRSGEQNTQSAVEADKQERSVEERVNDANAAANEINQQEIIGGGDGE